MNAPIQDDTMKVREVLKQFVLPAEIEKVRFDIRDDSAGEPALYLSFQVRVDADLSRESIARLSGFMGQVSDKLLRSGISLFPYASLDQAA